MLQGFNIKKAQGPDQISPRILEELGEEISSPLTDIYTKSIHTGLVPEDWRRAIITPIFKKGDTASATNFRPVSLTSVCSKLLEHIVVKHIISHLEVLDILSDNQDGFRAR